MSQENTLCNENPVTTPAVTCDELRVSVEGEAYMTDPLVEAEYQLEEEMLHTGLLAYRNRIQNSRQKHTESTMDYGKNLLATTVGPLSEAVEQFLVDAATKPGRRHIAAKHLTGIPADVVALIALKTVIDGISASDRTYACVCAMVGSRLNDEVIFTDFEKQNAALFQGVLKNLEKHPLGYQDNVRRTMLRHTARKFNIDHERWSRKTHLQVGVTVVELLIASTGIVRKQTTRVKHKRDETRLAPVEEVVNRIGLYTEHRELMLPFRMPMITPPREWSSEDSGGYYHHRMQTPLVQTNMRGHRKELAGRDMPLVYQAVNTLQETGWKINEAVLELVKEVRSAGVDVKGVPSEHNQPYPAEPDYVSNPTAWKEWKKVVGDIYRENRRAESKRIQIGKIQFIADEMLKHDSIFFPYWMDFRGRIYALPQYLNPQGCDLAKSLLTFSARKRLGSEGVKWLAIHVANTFGHDKVSFEDRIAWVHQNSDRIKNTVNDPTSDLWWTEADKPFQFLAAAVEWVGYLTDGGEDYESSLPIMVDGSCNGLQHFAAMLRDEKAGACVNLTPAEKPSDIYATVAERVIELLKEDGTELSRLWLQYGVDRKTCKRPVMILPYGGTREAVRQYTFDHIRERRDEGEAHPFGDKVADAASHLAGVIWQAMNQIVVGPRAAMNWLRKVASVVGTREVPLSWVTPSGFLAVQAYTNDTDRRIKTKVGDQVIQAVIREHLPELDRRKQGRALSPNFVHSLDASALCLTINRALGDSITVFAAVHDSYGTLAADMSALSACIRESFVEMYSQDVLADFAAQMQQAAPEETLPDLPPSGSLELTDVLRSEFFFA